MRRSSCIGILCLALLGAACGPSELEPPTIAGVTPAEVPDDVPTAVVVLGTHFSPKVQLDFDDPTLSTVDASFLLELTSSGLGLRAQPVHDDARDVGRQVDSGWGCLGNHRHVQFTVESV